MNIEQIIADLIAYIEWLSQTIPAAIQAFFSALGLA